MFASKNVLSLALAGLVGLLVGMVLGALALVGFLTWAELGAPHPWSE